MAQVALYKVGDKVDVVRNITRHCFQLREELTIFRVFTNQKDPHGIRMGTYYDAHNSNGDCCKIAEFELTDNKNVKAMKAMKDAVLTVAKDLAKANNTVTTLDIKTQLRRDYPYFFWDQKTVSAFMDQLAGDGLFTYTDNGTYRIYSLKNPPVSGPVSVPAKKVLTKTVKAGKGTANTVSTSGLIVFKVQKTKITMYKIPQLVSDPKFTALTLANGTTVTRGDIKAQKKSPLGYANPKLGKIKSVVVGTTQYNVK